MNIGFSKKIPNSIFYFLDSLFLFYFLLSTFYFLLSIPVSAEESSSTNFILRDPVITPASGFSTSTSFQYFSNTGQTVTGQATSTSFIGYSGFLYFATSTSPILTATAGNGQVSLSWTEAVGTLANITDYQLGTATVSGGPYTYQSLGNIYSYTKTGLTNSTAYYFIIRAYANTLGLAQSGESTATPSAPATPSPAPPSGGGGGGGGGGEVVTAVNFIGRAYPKSAVTILKDAQVAVSTVAGSDANFSVKLTGLSGGSYIFAVYSEDKDGRRSSLLTFPVSVTAGATTNVSGIFIAPTIAVDKSEVKRGDDLTIFGQSAPQADIVISVNSDEEFFSRIISDKNGIYLYNFDTSVLDFGSHNTKSKSSIGNQEISVYSYLVNFKVGTKNILVETTKCPGKSDLNNDCKVNLVDFSIAAYWYKRTLSADFKKTEISKLNGDGKVDLVDFSIMAYYWTG